MILKTQKSLTTKPLFNHFFPDGVFTFVSGKDVDFGLNTADSPFTPAQMNYLELIPGIRTGDIANVKQVHGKEIIIVRGRGAGTVEADGLITNLSGLPLVVRTADCLPVFLYDEKTPAVGLVHAGWRGTKEEITAQAVKSMITEFKTRPENMKAAFGPCIRAPRYEVGPEFLQHFPREVTADNHRYHFDLALANQHQLIGQGVRPENIYDCGICTFDDHNYHSYRRDGQGAGRILSMIMLKG
ncbi:MAG: peptidoglycan editing factor PgeF [Candidatus Omnitrophota bacterium]